jgi:hypothetical protein
MKKTVLTVANPEVPRTLPSDGTHVSTGHAAYGDKPAILEVGNAATRRYPNAPPIILTKGLHGVIWQSIVGYIAHIEFSSGVTARGLCTPFTVNRNLPVVPSVQAIISAKPNAAISGRYDGPNNRVRQTLFHRNRGDSEGAKAVEAIFCGDPKIAFTVLKEFCNVIAGKTFRLPKHIRPSLVHVQEAVVLSSNPHTAVAVPEEPLRLELWHSAWQRIRFSFPIHKLLDSAIHGDQECAVVAFNQTLYSIP